MDKQSINKTVLMGCDSTAEMLGVKPDTLADWRCRSPEKLPHIKVGRLVKYRLSDIEAFIEANVVGVDDTGRSGVRLERPDERDIGIGLNRVHPEITKRSLSDGL